MVRRRRQPFLKKVKHIFCLDIKKIKCYCGADHLANKKTYTPEIICSDAYVNPPPYESREIFTVSPSDYDFTPYQDDYWDRNKRKTKSIFKKDRDVLYPELSTHSFVLSTSDKKDNKYKSIFKKDRDDFYPELSTDLFIFPDIDKKGKKQKKLSTIFQKDKDELSPVLSTPSLVYPTKDKDRKEKKRKLFSKKDKNDLCPELSSHSFVSPTTSEKHRKEKKQKPTLKKDREELSPEPSTHSFVFPETYKERKEKKQKSIFKKIKEDLSPEPSTNSFFFSDTEKDRNKKKRKSKFKKNKDDLSPELSTHSFVFPDTDKDRKEKNQKSIFKKIKEDLSPEPSTHSFVFPDTDKDRKAKKRKPIIKKDRDELSPGLSTHSLASPTKHQHNKVKERKSIFKRNKDGLSPKLSTHTLESPTRSKVTKEKKHTLIFEKKKEDLSRTLSAHTLVSPATGKDKTEKKLKSIFVKNKDNNLSSKLRTHTLPAKDQDKKVKKRKSIFKKNIDDSSPKLSTHTSATIDQGKSKKKPKSIYETKKDNSSPKLSTHTLVLPSTGKDKKEKKRKSIFGKNKDDLSPKLSTSILSSSAAGKDTKEKKRKLILKENKDKLTSKESTQTLSLTNTINMDSKKDKRKSLPKKNKNEPSPKSMAAKKPEEVRKKSVLVEAKDKCGDGPCTKDDICTTDTKSCACALGDKIKYTKHCSKGVSVVDDKNKVNTKFLICKEGICRDAQKKRDSKFICKCVKRKQTHFECDENICRSADPSLQTITTIDKIKNKLSCFCRKYSQTLKENEKQEVCDEGVCYALKYKGKAVRCTCKKVPKSKECTDDTCSKKTTNTGDQTNDPLFEMKFSSKDMCLLNKAEIIAKVQKLGKPISGKQGPCICPSHKKLLSRYFKSNACADGVCEKATKNKKTNFTCKCLQKRVIRCSKDTCKANAHKEGKKTLFKTRRVVYGKAQPIIDERKKPLLEMKFDMNEMCVINSEDVKAKMKLLEKNKEQGDVCDYGICRENVDRRDVKTLCTCKPPHYGALECTYESCKSTSPPQKSSESFFAKLMSSTPQQKRHSRPRQFDTKSVTKWYQGVKSTQSENMHKNNGIKIRINNKQEPTKNQISTISQEDCNCCICGKNKSDCTCKHRKVKLGICTKMCTSITAFMKRKKQYTVNEPSPTKVPKNQDKTEPHLLKITKRSTLESKNKEEKIDNECQCYNVLVKTVKKRPNVEAISKDTKNKNETNKQSIPQGIKNKKRAEKQTLRSSNKKLNDTLCLCIKDHECQCDNVQTNTDNKKHANIQALVVATKNKKINNTICLCLKDHECQCDNVQVKTDKRHVTTPVKILHQLANKSKPSKPSKIPATVEKKKEKIIKTNIKTPPAPKPQTIPTKTAPTSNPSNKSPSPKKKLSSTCLCHHECKCKEIYEKTKRKQKLKQKMVKKKIKKVDPNIKRSKEKDKLKRKEQLKQQKEKDRQNKKEKSKSSSKMKKSLKNDMKYTEALKKKERKQRKKQAKIQRAQIKELKRQLGGKSEVQETSCCADFFLSIIKLLASAVSWACFISFRLITQPKLSFMYMKMRAKDPKGTLGRVKRALSDSWQLKKMKMERTLAGSENMTVLMDTIQDTPLYQAITPKGKTKEEAKKIELKNKKRKQRIRRREKQALYGCRHMVLVTLRRTPCLWVYHICPNFYPQCLSYLAFMRNFSYMLMFGLAVIVWTPCILLCELTRACFCCLLCTG